MALIPNLITAAPARMSHSDAAQMKSKHARKVPICIFVKKAARKGKSGAKFREVVYYHVLSGKFKGQLRPKVVAVSEKPRNGVRKMGKFRVTVTDQAAKVYALLDRFHTEAISEKHNHDIDAQSHNRIRAEIMANDPNSSKRGHYKDAISAVNLTPALFNPHHRHIGEMEMARREKLRKLNSKPLGTEKPSAKPKPAVKPKPASKPKGFERPVALREQLLRETEEATNGKMPEGGRRSRGSMFRLNADAEVKFQELQIERKKELDAENESFRKRYPSSASDGKPSDRDVAESKHRRLAAYHQSMANHHQRQAHDAPTESEAEARKALSNAHDKASAAHSRVSLAISDDRRSGKRSLSDEAKRSIKAAEAASKHANDNHKNFEEAFKPDATTDHYHEDMAHRHQERAHAHSVVLNSDPNASMADRQKHIKAIKAHSAAAKAHENVKRARGAGDRSKARDVAVSLSEKANDLSDGELPHTA